MGVALDYPLQALTSHLVTQPTAMNVVNTARKSLCIAVLMCVGLQNGADKLMNNSDTFH